MCTILAAILGVTALLIGAFKSGRREGCMSKFNALNEKITNSENEQQTNEKLSNQRFEYIEKKLEEIKEWQIEINGKMEKLFDAISKLPKRVVNGKEV
jgi:gas vesicle protein